MVVVQNSLGNISSRSCKITVKPFQIMVIPYHSNNECNELMLLTYVLLLYSEIRTNGSSSHLLFWYSFVNNTCTRKSYYVTKKYVLSCYNPIFEISSDLSNNTKFYFGFGKSHIYVIRCAIWYHLYNFRKCKNSHGGV